LFNPREVGGKLAGMHSARHARVTGREARWRDSARARIP
jgi:hypothetical protein